MTMLESPQVQTDHSQPFWWPSSLSFIEQNPYFKLGHCMIKVKSMKFGRNGVIND